MKIRWIPLLLASFLGLAGAGCSRGPTTPAESGPEPLQLPPVESMKVDLGLFQTAGAGAADLQDEEGLETPGRFGAATRFNWTNAVVRVLFIQGAVVAALTPPTLAFAAAIHTIPTLQPDGAFLWIYTWDDGEGHDFQIRLRGKVETDHVHWELRVTNLHADPPLDQALWFRGDSSLENDSGFWVFQDLDDPDLPEFARIDWDASAPDDRELSIENIRAGDDGEGDTLTYKLRGTMASIHFYDASADLESDITWDTVTMAGSLKVPDYNNGERACWDENQEDTVCPDETS